MISKKSKSFIVLLAIICVLAILLTGCTVNIGEDIVANGDFETYKDEKITDWKTFKELTEKDDEDFYSFKKTANAIGSDEHKTRGKYTWSITISNKYSTAYFTQKVRLVSGKLYKLSYDIKIENTIKGNTSNTDKFIGAYVGFLEDETFIRNNNIKNATSDWVTKEVYFESKIMGSTTLVAGIGHTEYGGARGSVAFDNIRVEAVNEVPPGIITNTLKPGSSVPENEVGGVVYTVLGAFATILLFFGGAILIRKLLKKQGIGADLDTQRESLLSVKSDIEIIDDDKIVTDTESVTSTASKKLNWFKAMFVKKEYVTKTGEAVVQSPIVKILTSPIALFMYALLACFAVRFLLLIFNGMADILAEMGRDALTIANDGPSKFYSISTGSVSNGTYPTGMLYLLYAIGGIADYTNLSYNSIGMTMLLRVPNIIADVVVCYLIFIMLNKHYSYKYSATFAGIYALLPMMFTASGLWGMYISIGLAFAIGMLYCMIEKNYIGTCICYMFALLFSNLMFVLLPLFIGYFIYFCIKDKKAILPMVLTSVICFIVYYCLALPFTIEYFKGTTPAVGVFMVFKKILVDFELNVLVSNSAFNLYAMFGMGNNVAGTAMRICTAILMTIFIVALAFLYIKSKNRLDIVLLAALSAIIYSVFSVGSKMEVMAIGIILLLLYSALKCEKRLFNISAVLSVLTFVNMGIVLTNSGFINFGDNLIGASFVNLLSGNAAFIIGSIITVITTCYLLYVAYDIMYNGYESDIKPMPNNWFAELKENAINKYDNIKAMFKRK